MTTKKSNDFDPTFEEVWSKLSKIDCSEHAEQKMGLTYLSWAWAWGILMEHYPYATFEFAPHTNEDGWQTEVWCTVRIGQLERTMWLPVMDHKNKAIPHPDARQVSDTRMRCLVKTLALYGLGFYIYAGEDVPQSGSSTDQTPPAVEPPPPPKQQAKKPRAKPKADTPVASSPAPTDEGAHVENEEAAIALVELISGFAEEITDMAGLADLWTKNKKLIDTLDNKFPAQHATLKATFTKVKQTIQGESK